MKKIMILFCVAVLAISTLTHAKFDTARSRSVGGGFDGPSNSYVTVRDALKRPDKTSVVLRGYIEEHLSGDNYTFKDQTGKITVEIQADTWRGLTVRPKDFVEIIGEIETSLTGDTGVKVNSIRTK